MSELGISLLVTIGLAAATAALQVWLKLVSRTRRRGRKHGLSRDDALWWTDWVVTATLALVISLMAAAHDGKPIGVAQVATCCLALFFGYSVMPFGLRFLAYGANAKINGWRWIIGANCTASLVLLSAVLVGVKIYA